MTVKITCGNCKQQRKAIKEWNYKLKTFVYRLKYCWGCYELSQKQRR